PVEVTDGERGAEQVSRLGRADDPRGPLGPELVPGRRQAVGRAVDHVHRPGPGMAAHVFERDADGQVRESVLVEVATHQGTTELVARLPDVSDAAAVLRPDLTPGGGEAAGRPVDDV